jgi:hypothetical protein
MQLSFDEFAAKYCEKQHQTPDGLKVRLREQKKSFQPLGWMLLECQVLDGSRMGELTILPYGPNNTYKEVPTHPVSPRGSASDMSVVVATLSAEDIP